VFSFRDSREGGVRVDVAFTDSSLDLQGVGPVQPAGLAVVEDVCGVAFARVDQVHGDHVVTVDRPGRTDSPGDALVSSTRGLGLMVRVADCVPVLLADADAGLVGAVHAGRPGLALGVVTRAVEQLRDRGAGRLTAWIGPHVCSGCYEVPDAMRAEVAAVVPASYAETTWGTPSLDLGAGVRSQLEALGVEVVEVGGCTREDPELHSYRRDGDAAGRMAGLVWMS